MYTKVTLVRFERNECCNLCDFQFESIKKDIVYNVAVLNDGIADGKDWFGSFMQSYKNELVGMCNVCSMIGIVVDYDFEREEINIPVVVEGEQLEGGTQ